MALEQSIPNVCAWCLEPIRHAPLVTWTGGGYMQRVVFHAEDEKPCHQQYRLMTMQRRGHRR